MTYRLYKKLALACAAPLLAGAFAAGAMAGNNPVDENWQPSEFGADDQLSADGAYEFLFAWAPIKLVGATGAPGNPIAAY